jgi:hypothetical protein
MHNKEHLPVWVPVIAANGFACLMVRRAIMALIAFAAGSACYASAAILDFSPAITHVPVKQGMSVNDVFTITTGGSFQGPVSLAISGLPTSIAASWSRNPVMLTSGTGSSTLTLTPGASVSPNWYTFSVTASGDGLSVAYLYTVEVEPASGLQVALSSPAISIPFSGSATLTLTAQAINGIALPSGASGASAQIVSALPAGVSASWSSPAVGYDTVSWTLTLSAQSTATTGSYPLSLSVQITDVNSGLVYSTNLNVPLLVSLLANVSVGGATGQSIPANFLGLSHEWYDAQSNMGSSLTGVNNIYRQLLANLTTYGSGPINLRIGGNSTDTSVEPTSTTVQPFAELATAMGNEFELGVNLGAANVNLAMDQTNNFVANMPTGSINAIEIGNEPDLYYQNGLRSSNYEFADYVQDYETWSAALIPLLPQGTKLAGPASDYYPQVASNVQTYLADFAPSLSLVSEHFYAASPEDNPPSDFLLSPAAAKSVISQPNFVSTVASAHAQGLKFREDELGSISEQGLHGISDAFGAALWSVNTMFQLAQVGVDGVNWEASDGNYCNPFTFAISSSGGTTTFALSSLNPLYYGLLFFQAAVGNGSQLLSVNATTPANLTAWATTPAGGTPRLTILNKDESLAGNVQVNMPGYSNATVFRLTAPSYQSFTGVSFAGQTLDGSTDGTLQGQLAGETISGVRGVFYVSMPVTSAALIISNY